MPAVVDSCVWIELLSDGALSTVAAQHLASPTEVKVPAMVLLEVYKWTYRERGEDAADLVAARMLQSELLEMTGPVALSAAMFCKDLNLATADATVLAHAVVANLPLVTFDHHFEKLPGANYRATGKRRNLVIKLQ